MTDEDAFLAAVLDRPDDGTPRLVYADWLDDHGGEAGEHRAKMIRGMLDPAGPQRWRTTFPEIADIIHGDRRFSLWIDGICHERADDQQSSDDSTPAVYIRRGFVGELRVAPLDVLLGGECGRCGGEGRVESPNPEFTRRCPGCEGTPGGDDYRCSGRTPGLAAAVFARHPVTRVVVADREPVRFEGRVMWHNAGHRLTSSGYAGYERPADHLPACVFGRLGGFAKQPGRLTEMVRSYPTRAAALDALSHALVDHCRGLVGLPPVYGPGATTGVVDSAKCGV